MKTKVATLTVIIALLSSLSGTSVFAGTVNEGNVPVENAKTSGKSVPPSDEKAALNRKLSADMQKLVSDAKAGKIAPRSQQIPNNKRNNLSTAAKIGIIAAIGGLIFAIIAVHQINDD